jgi:hypothetical protein
MSDRLAVAPILSRLRDFQRRTVEYVFQRMYLDQERATRFLVADEVGLGKTMVARGIIAKTIRHLEEQGVGRIDIIYVCSNAAIANQNLNRLNVYGNRHFSMATRLTLLPAHLKGLKANRINFVSFTPGTTFDLKNRSGVMEERRVLYHMLREEFDLSRTGLLNLLQGTAGKDRWRVYAEQQIELDRHLERLFQQKLRQDRGLLAKLRETAEEFHRHRDFSWDESNRRYQVISGLRRTLARVCVDALEPDLVILDEFQRFKQLLHGDDDAAQLAQALFDHPEVRVLLLSATPYKMLTLHHETDEDHYEDFHRTLEFLLGSKQAVAEVASNLDRFRRALHGLGQGSEEEAEQSRSAIENGLRRVIVRTERVPATEQRDAMLSEPTIAAQLQPADLKQAVVVDQIAKALKSWDAIEYWKSSPYLLNVMKEYEMKRLLRAQMKRPSQELVDALARAQNQLLRRGHFERYRELDPANGRLRSLMDATVNQGQWRLLWLPPSLPYWQPTGAYADQPSMTKALVFSAWQVVSDAIAMFCSYEAERRMLGQDRSRPRYSSLVKSRRGLLRFAASAEDRLAGMPLFCLLYPCIALAADLDPLAIGLECDGGGPPSIDWVKARVKEKIAAMLRQTGCWPTSEEGREDQRWYWAALAILDARHAPWIKAWCSSSDPTGWRQVGVEADEEAASGFARHADYFAEFMDGSSDLGRAPEDLLDVLVEVALASPAVCALRALRRVVRWIDLDDRALLNAAARIGGGFRTLFNLPEAMGLLRAEDGGLPYWRRVLQYCLEGNLPAVLDEYLHWLRESLGLVDQNARDSVTQLGETVWEALSVKPSLLELDQIRVAPRTGAILLDPFRLRSRFAMRFGTVRGEQDDTLARAETVQKAFNSPFRPFILASTSIGQEGLDFHPYCHVVYHWNLPSNPVDLEQREGRVHRYKGHAIRKNLALRFGLRGLRRVYQYGDDPWTTLFDLASAERPAGKDDLEPYWVYPVEGGSSVERRVPMLPFSKEQQRLPDLRASLAVYRLVFGQPRQEDLLSHLKGRPPEELARWRISLAPPPLTSDIAPSATPAAESGSDFDLYCRRCGQAVPHRCVESDAVELHWQSGDQVMFLYWSRRNGGPQYCPGEVEAVNDGVAEVSFPEFKGTLRRRGGDIFWDSNSRERCRLVSHWDPSGGPAIALVCPKCGGHGSHSCDVNPIRPCHKFKQGERILVTYPPSDGIDAGTFTGSVVRSSGKVVRVHLQYEVTSCETVHLVQNAACDWLDLEYGVPCQVVRAG